MRLLEKPAKVCINSTKAECLSSLAHIKQGLTTLNATVGKMIAHDCPAPQVCQLELSSVQVNIASTVQSLNDAIATCNLSPISLKCLGKVGSLTFYLSSVAGALGFAKSSCNCGSGFPPPVDAAIAAGRSAVSGAMVS